MTEERLRSWLDSDQASRERLCVGILLFDKRFTEVKPRRPKGGPDGAHDIEAKYKHQDAVWGAIGFRNSVNDSSEDKKWVKKKFRTDVENAKRRKEDLWGFVFFTNVDLTPGEVTKLEQHAKAKGISFVEVFYRERLRVELDKPIGIALRSQCLEIEPSHAENASFLAEFGADLKSLVVQGFKGT